MADANPFAQFAYPTQVDPEVQAQRERARLDLLNEEKAQSDNPFEKLAVDKEIAVNKPVMGQVAPPTAQPDANPFAQFAKADDNPFAKFSGQSRAMSRMTDAMHSTFDDIKNNESPALMAGAAAGLPIGVAEFMGGALQQVGRLGKVAVDPSKWDPKTILSILNEPTLSDEFQQWMKNKAPAFSAGVNAINAPFSIPFAGASGALSEGVERATGSPVAGQLSEHALNILLAALGARGMIKGGKAVNEPRPEPKVDDTVPSPKGADVGPSDLAQGLPPDAVDPTQQGSLFSDNPEGSLTDMPWKTDENGVPYKQDLSSPDQADLFTPDEVPQDRSPQNPLPENNTLVNPDDLNGTYRKLRGERKDTIQKTERPPNTLPEDMPPNRDAQGNLIDEGYYVDNIERQGQDKPSVDQGPDSIPYYPDNPTKMADENRATEVDKAWEQFNADRTDSLGTNTDNPRRRNQPPLSRSGFRRSQSGSVDIPGPVADLAKFIRNKIIRRVGNENRPRLVYRATYGDSRVQPGEWVTPNSDLAKNVYGKGDERGTPKIITDVLPGKDLYEVHPGGWIYAPEGTDISNVVRHVAQDGTKVTMGDVLRRAGETVGQVPHYDGRPRSMKETAAAADKKAQLFTGLRKKQGGAIDFSAFGKGDKIEETLKRAGYTFEKTIDGGWETKVNGKYIDFHETREAAIKAALGNFGERQPRSHQEIPYKNEEEKRVFEDLKQRMQEHQDTSKAMVALGDWKFKSGDVVRGQKGIITIKGQGWSDKRGKSEPYYYHGDFISYDGQHQSSGTFSKSKFEELYGDQAKSKGAPKGDHNQSGMINFGAMFGKDKPTRGPEGMSKDNMRDIIAGYLSTSRSPESFKTKLDLFSDDPSWVNKVVNRADALWADKDNILRDYPGSVYNKLTSTEQKLTADLRSGPIFMKEEKPQQLPGSADISIANRITAPTSIIRRMSNPQARKWLNWVISNTQEFANMGTKLYKRMSDDMAKFSQLSRKEQLGVIDAVIKLDGTQNNMLKDAGVQWATADMLRKMGLNDYQIEAYQHMTKALDKSWDLIRQVFLDQGRESPDRIPGYFPHVWLGSYRLLIADENGLHTMRTYQTKYGRAAALKAAKKEFPNDVITTEDPSASIKDNNVVDALVQALQVFQNKDGLSQAIMAKLSRMDESQTRGIIKEALEREGVHGYTAEDGIKTDLPMMGRGHNDRMLVAYQRYLEHVSRFWVNSQIATHVKGIINENGHVFDKTPQLRRYLDDFISTATGHSTNHDTLPSEAMRSVAIMAGLPPNTIPKILSDLGKYTVMVRLRVPNPRFMIANLLQPVTQLTDLLQVHSDRILGQERGEDIKTGNVLKAMSTVTGEMVNVRKQGSWSPWAREALKYARDNNKITVFMADHVDPIKQTDTIGKVQSLVLDKPNNWIEERGRVATYLGHVAYNLDAGMPKREAYEAAANQIDLAMGNYNKMHQPTMYSNFGIGGQLIRPFALLRNVYLGKFAMALQTLGQSLKTSPKASAYAGLNVGSYLASWIVFAGAVGALGFNEADALIRMVNQTFDLDHPWPRMGAIIRKLGAPNWLLYGLVSTATDVNLGPSLGAPALTEAAGIPAFDTAKNFASLGIQGFQALQDTGADKQEVYEAGRKLVPNIAQPWVEKMIADKQGGVTPQPTNFDNGYRRTDKDFAIAALTGARSLEEQDARDVHGLTKYDEDANKNWKKQQVSKMVDSLLGIGPDNFEALVRAAFETNRGFDADSLKLAIKKELDRRMTDAPTADLQDIKRTDNPAEKAYKAQRYQELNRMNK